MKLLNRDEARKLDTLAMNTYGLPEAVLMENAGASVVALTEGDVSWKDARVVILCGERQQWRRRLCYRPLCVAG